MAGVASAAVVSGELIIGLDDGTLIRCGYIQGPTGLTGPQGPMGPQGRPGIDGNTLLHGAGVPTFDDGKDNDWYIDSKNYRLYGPKTGGKWGSGVALLPKDRGMELPTGMKAQGSGASGRFFAGGISGPSSGGIPTGSGTGGPSPILTNGTPMVAGVSTLIAEDSSGDAMIVDLWAQSAQGTLFTEVAVSKGNGTDTGYSVVYEIQMGVQPPVLTFTPGVTARGALQLSISSDVALTNIRGRVMYL